MTNYTSDAPLTFTFEIEIENPAVPARKEKQRLRPVKACDRCQLVRRRCKPDPNCEDRCLTCVEKDGLRICEWNARSQFLVEKQAKKERKALKRGAEGNRGGSSRGDDSALSAPQAIAYKPRRTRKRKADFDSSPSGATSTSRKPEENYFNNSASIPVDDGQTSIITHLAKSREVSRPTPYPPGNICTQGFDHLIHANPFAIQSFHSPEPINQLPLLAGPITPPDLPLRYGNDVQMFYTYALYQCLDVLKDFGADFWKLWENDWKESFANRQLDPLLSNALVAFAARFVGGDFSKGRQGARFEAGKDSWDLCKVLFEERKLHCYLVTSLDHMYALVLMSWVASGYSQTDSEEAQDYGNRAIAMLLELDKEENVEGLCHTVIARSASLSTDVDPFPKALERLALGWFCVARIEASLTWRDACPAQQRLRPRHSPIIRRYQASRSSDAVPSQHSQAMQKMTLILGQINDLRQELRHGNIPKLKNTINNIIENLDPSIKATLDNFNAFRVNGAGAFFAQSQLTIFAYEIMVYCPDYIKFEVNINVLPRSRSPTMRNHDLDRACDSASKLVRFAKDVKATTGNIKYLTGTLPCLNLVFGPIAGALSRRKWAGNAGDTVALIIEDFMELIDPIRDLWSNLEPIWWDLAHVRNQIRRTPSPMISVQSMELQQCHIAQYYPCATLGDDVHFGVVNVHNHTTSSFEISARPPPLVPTLQHPPHAVEFTIQDTSILDTGAAWHEPMPVQHPLTVRGGTESSTSPSATWMGPKYWDLLNAAFNYGHRDGGSFPSAAAFPPSPVIGLDSQLPHDFLDHNNIGAPHA